MPDCVLCGHRAGEHGSKYGEVIPICWACDESRSARVAGGAWHEYEGGL